MQPLNTRKAKNSRSFNPSSNLAPQFRSMSVITPNETQRPIKIRYGLQDRIRLPPNGTTGSNKYTAVRAGGRAVGERAAPQTSLFSCFPTS